jgi:hypothetical protein
MQSIPQCVHPQVPQLRNDDRKCLEKPFADRCEVVKKRLKWQMPGEGRLRNRLGEQPEGRAMTTEDLTSIAVRRTTSEKK